MRPLAWGPIDLIRSMIGREQESTWMEEGPEKNAARKWRQAQGRGAGETNHLSTSMCSSSLQNREKTNVYVVATVSVAFCYYSPGSQFSKHVPQAPSSTGYFLLWCLDLRTTGSPSRWAEMPLTRVVFNHRSYQRPISSERLQRTEGDELKVVKNQDSRTY